MIGAWRTCFLLFALVPAGQGAIWTDTFSEPRIDPVRWHIFSDGDLREWSVQVAGLPQTGGSGRLGIRADTRGTTDETIKVVGVRSVHPIALKPDVRVSVDLDWNAQANGSYLSAAMVLSPHATLQSAFKSADWLKVEYVGVPPGRNARMVVGLQRAGHERTLFNEGWPARGRAGRTISLQRLAMVVYDGAVEVWENDTRLYESKDRLVTFDSAYVYLQMSSHSNYPARTVYFDNVGVARSATKVNH